ncbi:methyl-accepting chemotaxis protein [Glaciecola sp. MF2-115]|uniref:methyl-accepting chemotaxis protein n=1 Tax=Glaciecola sp. MF2-115 TaxID=3384827 RepID=UPI0039A0F6B4
MSLRIQQKLRIIGALVLVGFVGFYVQSTVNQSSLSKMVSINSELQKIESLMLQLRRNEKDFLMRLDPKYLTSFNTTVEQINPILNSLELDLAEIGISEGEIPNIGPNIEKYRLKFEALVNESVNKGLDKDSGNYGKLRRATHELEEVLANNNNLQAQVYLLTLRRHEKDFMLRNDEKYVGRLKDVSAQLDKLLSDTNSKRLLATYVSEFESFLNISKNIGLDSKSGLRGEMRSIIHTVEKDLNTEIPRISEEVEAKRSFNHIVSVIGTLGLSIIIFGAVMVVAKQILDPLRSFSRRISAIRQSNDLSQRVEESDDEIGDIAKEFNIFMSHFQNLIKSINKTVGALEESTSIVSNSVLKTSESLQLQAKESDMVVSAVSEMGMTAKEIARNAQSTQERTDKASLKADEGKHKLTITLAQIEDLSSELIEAGDNIVQLKDKSDGINSVLEVIKAIAEQTNLLALNAAIEAARAGEQGRGFAVVADEVRTLAVRTQESTAEITNIISELQTTTSDIVIKVNHCKDQGISSLSQARETEDVLNEIMTDVAGIAQMTIQVASAVEEQSAVVTEVDKNLVSMRTISDQVAADSQDNAKASQQVEELAKTLHKEASIFKI